MGDGFQGGDRGGLPFGRDQQDIEPAVKRGHVRDVAQPLHPRRETQGGGLLTERAGVCRALGRAVLTAGVPQAQLGGRGDQGEGLKREFPLLDRDQCADAPDDPWRARPGRRRQVGRDAVGQTIGHALLPGGGPAIVMPFHSRAEPDEAFTQQDRGPAVQPALAAEHMQQNAATLKPAVYRVPIEIDREIARLKLDAMGIDIDTLTPEQARYLASWQEGT